MNRTRTPQTDPGALPLEGVEHTIEALEPEAPAPAQLVTRPVAAPVATRQAPTPMALLQIAMDQGADLDRLERLMMMQERWEANEARKAFNVAFAAFKANPPRITKNKQVRFTTSKGTTEYWHATLDEVVEAVAPALAVHGLSHRWGVEQKNSRVYVTCYLQHQLGHAESLTMDGPLDDSGNKNNIQMAGSTVTYLERYTLLAITGMAVQGQDTDGRPPEGKLEAVEMPEAEFQNHLARIKAAADDEALKTAYGEAVKACHPQDKDTIGAFGKAKNDRYRALHPKPQGGAQ